LLVRNAATTITAVVGSVLAQRHDNLELIVLDNASTDGTERFDSNADSNREIANAAPLSRWTPLLRRLADWWTRRSGRLQHLERDAGPL
jgi:glycosyltransferase involved in cell wall biosynthesis